MGLYCGTSEDGIKWNISEEPIKFNGADPDIASFHYGYDPRVCWLEDRYYVTWCNWYHGATIGMAYTYDFKEFTQVENTFLPFNRNGVLFPRKIGGKYVMLSRPSDNGHTPFGDIFLSQSPDMVHWGCHRFVMAANGGWQSTKIGAGPVPIETSEGWLLIYHGVLTSCNGFVYCAGAALLDLEKPWKVLYRTAPYILNPVEPYELTGDTPNVVFPCAALCDAATGRLAIYYGAADTSTCVAYTTVDELIAYTKANSMG
jgi:beta-1,4-mannooligosaccharide/beta-1,4-mannosyl-N-acetylglucosamine phosphorylase